MRVAYLTAGAGGMYCGSCMRDNTLAAALIRKRREVVLIPVYSPIRTDEADVSNSRVVFGGINVFLQQKFPFLSRLPRVAERLLDHPSLLRLAMKRAGSTPAEAAAPYTLSILRGEDGAQRREVEKLIEYLRELRPALVHLPDAFFIGLAGPIKRALNVPVVCTLTGEDILLEKMPRRFRDEAFAIIRERGRAVDAFIAVSHYYAGYCVERFGIAPERIHHVPLGINLSGVDDPPRALERPFTIGYLARICHEKGLHQLCEAFGVLHGQGRRCRLKVAGYLGDSDRGYFEEVKKTLRNRGLLEFVDFLGEVDRPEKFRMLRSIDAFSVPTTYREAKGLYVLEAMSQGVPVVQPDHGSFPELIAATGGGILVKPGDVSALADAIGALMGDSRRRAELGRAGRAAVRSCFTDEVMADEAWTLFEALAGSAISAGR